MAIKENESDYDAINTNAMTSSVFNYSGGSKSGLSPLGRDLMITESGDFMITESGDFMLTEH